jgi:DNA polymerase-3 subunit epsilon
MNDDSGIGICTLRHTCEKLPLACESYGIKPPQHHRALSDARATAELLRAIRPAEPSRPIAVNNLATELNLRTHRRCADDSRNVLDRLLSRMTYEGIDPSYLAYIDLLDWALDDFVITQDERRHLEFVAEELNMDSVQIEKAHQEYFQALVTGAQKDGVITADEHHLLTMVANALGLRLALVPGVTDRNDEFKEIKPGSSICFTGTFVDRNGEALSRAIQDMASNAGYQVVSNVTKSKCDVLVAVDPCSNSGKAKKARAYGKPVVSAERFLTLL